MKKTKLQVAYQFEFELLGIVTAIKDYKIAWAANKLLNISLIRTEDYVLAFNNGSVLNISQFKDNREHGFIQLLRNKSHGESPDALYLVPELKMIDYFLLIQDLTGLLDINDYIARLSKSPLIQNVVRVEIDKLNSRENLLTY